MKLCFIGSGVEKESVRIGCIEINSIVSVLIKKYDTLIYGGSYTGIMGEFAKSFKHHGGKVISVVPEWLIEKELIFKESDEIIKCQSILDRKNIMFKKCDDILCYPGGIGTIDELFTYLACDTLETTFNKCNVYVYNFEKYYSPMLLQIETAKECGMIKSNKELSIKTFEYADQLGMLL